MKIEQISGSGTLPQVLKDVARNILLQNSMFQNQACVLQAAVRPGTLIYPGRLLQRTVQIISKDKSLLLCSNSQILTGLIHKQAG